MPYTNGFALYTTKSKCQGLFSPAGRSLIVNTIMPFMHAMGYLKTILLLAGLLPTLAPAQKVGGLALEMPPRPISYEQYQTVGQTGANWVALIPYGFSRNGQAKVIYDGTQKWWGESPAGVKGLASYARQMGQKILIKPHVWIGGQGWPGDFDLNTEAEWLEWENSYEAYIMQMAHLADSLQADMFCVGTEYRIAVVKREAFWRQLVGKVRQVYKGPVTYAANWDNYQKVTWWDALDYIGVDAYFPLAAGASPSVAAIAKAWQPVKQALKAFSQRYSKPVLFTEWGYVSRDYATEGHWVQKEGAQSNTYLQSKAYQAMFEVFWQEPWFAGGFAWKWYLRANLRQRAATVGFTPQGKAATQVLRKYYALKSTE